MATEFNDVLNVQRGNQSGGAGDDTFILAGNLIEANEQITISDAEGSNRIQLIGGLSITGSSSTAEATQLTLSNGAVVTVLGADTFTYEVGGDPFDPNDNGTSENYATFVTNTLGLASVPTDNTPVAGGAVTISDTGSGGSTVSVSAADVTVDEDAGTATITLQLSAAATGTVSVSYASASGTVANEAAISGTDFTAASGTATFAPGATTATITVNITDDTQFELDEKFSVGLSNPTSTEATETVSLTDNSVEVTITDNDPNSTPTATLPEDAGAYIGVNTTVSGLQVADANDGNVTVTLTGAGGGLIEATNPGGGNAATVQNSLGVNISGQAANQVIIAGSITDVNAILNAIEYQTNRTTPGIDVVSVKVVDPNEALDPTGSVLETSFNVNVGKQFTFTAGNDDFTGATNGGTGGNDLFVLTDAGGLLSNTNDKADGSDGVDTLQVTGLGAAESIFNAAGGTAMTTPFNDIEVLDITTDGGISFDVDGDDFSGDLTKIKHTGGAVNDTLDLNDLPSGVDVLLNTDTNTTVNIDPKASNGTLDVMLADGVDIAALLIGQTAAWSTLNITDSTGSNGNDLDATGSDFEAQTINISGSNTGTMDFGTLLASSVIKTVDASGKTAGVVDIDLTNVTTSGGVTLSGGAGNDVLEGPDTVAGTINGNAGNDTITGNSSADTLLGGSGDDTIVGNAGNDTITGGTGKDTLTGGANDVDTFVFAPGDSTSGSNRDVIVDLENGDKIDLSGFSQAASLSNGSTLSQNAGTKSANGSLDVYLDTTNQLLVVETADDGSTVTSEEIFIDNQVLGAFTSNGSGVFTTGPIALQATNDEVGTLTVFGSPINYPNDLLLNIDLDNSDTIVAPEVDLDGDNDAVGDATSAVGTNGVNNVDASGLLTIGINIIAGGTTANTINNIIGSGQVDNIVTEGGNDVISGRGGNDTLNGGDGNDTITGGIGQDTIIPGNGDDTVDLTETTAASDTVTIALADTGEGDAITAFTRGATNGDIIDLDGSTLAGGDNGVADTTDDGTDDIAAAGAIAVNATNAALTTAGVVVYGFTTDIGGTTDFTTSNDAAIVAAVEAALESTTANVLSGTATSAVTQGAANTNLLLAFSDGTNTAIVHYAEGGASEADYNGELSVIGVLNGVTPTGLTHDNFFA